VAEELIAFASKQELLAKSKQFWNPGKTQFWIDSGVPLVIDRRAYDSDRSEPFGDFAGLVPWQAPSGPVPPYPVASNRLLVTEPVNLSAGEDGPVLAAPPGATGWGQ